MASSEYTSVRIFVSSTFRDQQSTRTVLSRSVVPRLEEWGTSWYINTQLVDLRWGGVTPEESAQGKAVELCLQEVDRADVVLAIVGQRYGWTPDHYLPEGTRLGARRRDTAADRGRGRSLGQRRVSFAGADSDEDESEARGSKHESQDSQTLDEGEGGELDPLDWVRDYPKGRSITELELQRAALNKSAKERAARVQQTIFYIQDGSWLEQVPDVYKGSFVDGELDVVGYRRLSDAVDEEGSASPGEQQQLVRTNSSSTAVVLPSGESAGGMDADSGKPYSGDPLATGPLEGAAGPRGLRVNTGAGDDGDEGSVGPSSSPPRPASRMRKPIYKFNVDSHKAELLRKLCTRIRLAAARRSDVTLVDRVPCEYRAPIQSKPKHGTSEKDKAQQSRRSQFQSDLEHIKHQPRIGGLSRWAEDVLHRLRLAVARVVANRRARQGADPGIIEQMAQTMASTHGEGRDSAQMAGAGRATLLNTKGVFRSTRKLAVGSSDGQSHSSMSKVGSSDGGLARGPGASRPSMGRRSLSSTSVAGGSEAGKRVPGSGASSSLPMSVHREAEASAWRQARRSSEQVCALLNVRTVGRTGLVNAAVGSLARSQPVPLWEASEWKQLVQSLSMQMPDLDSGVGSQRSESPPLGVGHSRRAAGGRTGVPDLDGELHRPTVGLASAVVMWGPPGVGKTSLLASMAHGLRRSVEKAVGPARAGAWRPSAQFQKHEIGDIASGSGFPDDGGTTRMLREEAPAVITHLVGMGGGSSVQVRDVIQRLCVEIRRVTGPGLPPASVRGRTTGGREVECALAWLAQDAYVQNELEKNARKHTSPRGQRQQQQTAQRVQSEQGGLLQRRSSAESFVSDIGATRVGEEAGLAVDDAVAYDSSSSEGEDTSRRAGISGASFTSSGKKRTRYGASNFPTTSSFDALLAEQEWEYDPPPLPDDPRELRSILTGLLEIAAARRPVILIIDAVDDMQDVVLGQRAEAAPTTGKASAVSVARQSVLDVLPHKQLLPARVHVIVSVRTDVSTSDPETEADVIRSSDWSAENLSLSSLEARGYTPIALRPLSQTASRRAAIAMLRRHGKRMESAQLDALSSRDCSRLPLWLAVSTEELRVFGVYEKVLDRIRALPDSLTLLFDQYLERLEIDHGRAVVATVVTLLVASNEPGGGRLSEEELQGIMAFPPLVWTSLRLALRPYLAGSIASEGVGEELVAIAVGPLARAVRRRYWGHFRASALEPQFIPTASQLEAGVGHGASGVLGTSGDPSAAFRGIREEGSSELHAERQKFQDDDDATSVGASSIGVGSTTAMRFDDSTSSGPHDTRRSMAGLAGRSVVSSASRSLPGALGQLGRLLVNSSPYPRAVHLFLAGFMLQRALGHGVADSALHSSLRDLKKSLKGVISADASMRAAAEARARIVHEAAMAVETKDKQMASKSRWASEAGDSKGSGAVPQPGSHAAKVAEARALLAGKAGAGGSSSDPDSDSDDSIDWFFSARLLNAKEGDTKAAGEVEEQKLNQSARAKRASMAPGGTKALVARRGSVSQSGLIGGRDIDPSSAVGGLSMQVLPSAESDTARRIRRERRGSILKEVASAWDSRAVGKGGGTSSDDDGGLNDDVKKWLGSAMRLDQPSGGGGSIDAPARSLVGPWDVGSAAAVRALRAIPVQLLYAARYRDAAALLTSLSYIEAMATTGNLFLVSDLLKSWLATANQASKRVKQHPAPTSTSPNGPFVFEATGTNTSHLRGDIRKTGVHPGSSFYSQKSGVAEGLGGLTTPSGGSVFLPERQQAPRQQDILRVVATSQFIAANAAVLSQLPQILFQMAANLPSTHPLTHSSDASWKLLSEGRSFFRHLNKPEQRDPCLATLSGHWAPVVAGQFDPDNGQYIVTGSMDGRARLWDVRSGDCVALWDSAEHAPAIEMGSRPARSRGSPRRKGRMPSGMVSPLVRPVNAPSPSSQHGRQRRNPGSGMVRRLSIATRILARVGVTACSIRPSTTNIVALGLQDGRLVLWDYSQLLSKVMYGPVRDQGGTSILKRKSIFASSKASPSPGSGSRSGGAFSRIGRHAPSGSFSPSGNRGTTPVFGHKRRGSIDKSSTQSTDASPSLKMLAAMHLPAHPASITALEWSEDGSHLCSGDAEGRVVLWSFNTEGALSFAQAEDQPLPVAAWRAVGGGLRHMGGAEATPLSRIDRLSMATDSCRVHRAKQAQNLKESQQFSRPHVHRGKGVRDAVRTISFVGPIAPLRPQGVTKAAPYGSPGTSGSRDEGKEYMGDERSAHLLDRLVIVSGHRQVQVWDGEWRPGFVPLQPREGDEGSYGGATASKHSGSVGAERMVSSSESSDSSSEEEAVVASGSLGGRRSSFGFDDATLHDASAAPGDHSGNPGTAALHGVFSPMSRHFLRKQELTTRPPSTQHGRTGSRDSARPHSRSTRRSRKDRVRQLHEFSKGGGFSRTGQVRLVASTLVRSLHAGTIRPAIHNGSGSTSVAVSSPVSPLQSQALVARHSASSPVEGPSVFTLGSDAGGSPGGLDQILSRSDQDASAAHGSIQWSQADNIIDTDWLADMPSHQLDFLLRSQIVQTPGVREPASMSPPVFMALLQPSNGGLDAVGLDYVMQLPPGVSHPRLLLDAEDTSALAMSKKRELPRDAAAALLAKSIVGRATPADKRRIVDISQRSCTMAELAHSQMASSRDRGARAIVRAVAEQSSTDFKNDLLVGSVLLKSANGNRLASANPQLCQRSVLDTVTAEAKQGAVFRPGSVAAASRSVPRLGHSLSGMVHSQSSLTISSQGLRSDPLRSIVGGSRGAGRGLGPHGSLTSVGTTESKAPDLSGRGLQLSRSTPSLGMRSSVAVAGTNNSTVTSLADPVRARARTPAFVARPLSELTTAASRKSASVTTSGARAGSRPGTTIQHLRASAREVASVADEHDQAVLRRQLKSEQRYRSPVRRLPPALAGQHEAKQTLEQARLSTMRPVLGMRSDWPRAAEQSSLVVRQDLVPGSTRPPTSDPSARYDAIHAVGPQLRGALGARGNGSADLLPPASFDESIGEEMPGGALQTGIEGALGASARVVTLRRGKVGSKGVAQDAEHGAAWIRQQSSLAKSSAAGIRGGGADGISSLTLPSGSMLSPSALGRLGAIPVCAAFSGIGRVTVGCSDGKARVFRVDTGTSCGVLAGHRDAVVHLAYSPSGRLLLTTSIDGLAKVWKPNLLAHGLRELPHSAPVRGAGISRYLNVYKAATADERGNIKVVDLDGRKIATLSIRTAFGSRLGGVSTAAAEAASAALRKSRAGGPDAVADRAAKQAEGQAPVAPERSVSLEFVHGGTRLITISGSGAAVWPLPYIPRSSQTDGAREAQMLEDPEFYGKHAGLDRQDAGVQQRKVPESSGTAAASNQRQPQSQKVLVTKSVLSSLQNRGNIRQRDGGSKSGAQNQKAAAFSREVMSSESRILAITPALPPALQRLEAGAGSSKQAEGTPLQGKSSGIQELGGTVQIGGQVRKAHVLCRSPVDCWAISSDGGTMALARSADDQPWAPSQRAFSAKRPGTAAAAGLQSDRERVFAGRKQKLGAGGAGRESDAGQMIELFDTINGKRFEVLLPPGVSTDASGAGARPDPSIRARSLAFSPDGTILVAACNDGTLRCVVLHELLSRRAKASGARSSGGSFAFALGQSSWAEGPHVLVLGDVRTAASALTGAASVADHAVKSCLFSPTANFLMCLSASPRIAVWRFAQPEEPDDVDPREVERQRKETSDASVGARRGSMMLLERGDAGKKPRKGGSSSAGRGAAKPPAYHALAVGTAKAAAADGLERVRLQSGAGQRRDPGHESMVQLYGESAAKKSEWKTSSGRPQARPSVATILQLYAPPGSRLPAAARRKITLEELVEKGSSSKGEVRGRDGRRRGVGVGQCEYLEGHVVAPDDADWCPHGQRIVSCSRSENAVAIFHVQTKQIVATANVPMPSQVTWSSDGVRIVVGTEDHRVFVLLNTHQSTFVTAKLRVCSLWMPRTSVATTLSFSRGGSHVVMGDALGNVDLLRHESGFTLKGSIDWLGDEDLEKRGGGGGQEEAGATGGAGGPASQSTDDHDRDREYPLQRALPVAVARRIYYPDRRVWGNRTEAFCQRCGFVFRVPSSSLGAAASIRKTAQRFGWKQAHLHDARLQVRCSRCRKLHRLSPLVVSTVAGATTSGKAS